MDIMPTSLLYQHWCLSRLEDQSPIDGNQWSPPSQSSNKDGRAIDSCFALIGAHQRGGLIVDAAWEGTLLAVSHCRGRDDKMVITGYYTYQPVHKYWCLSRLGDRSLIDGNQWSPRPKSSNKDGRVTDSCFSLIGTHQCGSSIFVGWLRARRSLVAINRTSIPQLAETPILV